MNQSAGIGEEPGKSSCNGELLTHERRVQHLASGYSNSQEVVRFLDTKAAATIGAVPIFVGAAVAACSWIVADPSWLKWTAYSRIPCYTLLLSACITVFIGVFSAISTLASAFHVLIPRDTGTTPPSVLFPFKRPARDNAAGAQESFDERVNLFVQGGSKEDELEDYRRQVSRLGEIVAEKIIAGGISIRWLRRLLFAVIGTIAFLGIARITCWYIAP